MASEIQRTQSGRSQKWTRSSSKKVEASYSSDFSDDGEECYRYLDHSFTGISSTSARTQHNTLTHELRIFVGTWNVGGRSPARTLAGDLEEWLNLKSAVDIYVLGFQEVVPLNTRTVMGVLDDHSETAKWNLLIGKTLNNKEGCVWLTPTSNPTTSDEYEYVRAQKPGKKINRSTTPMRERAKTHHGESSGPNSSFKLMASKKMVGVFITIWMRRDLLRKYSISNVKVCSVACGIMGYLGNKGSVSVSMSIEGTSFCFLTAHLASGEKKGDEGRRNQQVVEIFKRTSFSRVHQENLVPLPTNILGHDRIFWFGDLNYRLNLEDGLARELIKRRKFKELHKFDQLKKEQEEKGVFQGWREGNIEFAPTYKYYLSTSNKYSGNLPTRSGDKHRTPAWCDRIMWYGKGIQQLSYVCGDIRFSDHRPVSAIFTTEIEIPNSNPKGVTLSKFLASMNLSRSNGQKKVADEPRSTLQTLIKTEIEESSTQMHSLQVFSIFNSSSPDLLVQSRCLLVC
ncbi:hypothetical protein V2J09_017532 [Rumex salicifolius]